MIGRSLSIKRGTIVFLSMFIFGVTLRIGFGLLRPTDDLAFYIGNFSYTQISRLGFEKSLLFYPLVFFGTEAARVIALAVIMAALNTIAAIRLLRRSGQNATFFLMFLVLVNWFFAQIDMHLVRQQIAVYLFLIAISSRRFGISAIILLVLAILYHEVILLLFCGWLGAWVLQKSSLSWIQGFLSYLSFGVIGVIFLQTGNLSVVFLLFVLLAFNAFKREPKGISLDMTLSNVIIVIFVVYAGGLLPQYVTLITLERAIGVFVSLGLFRLLFDGKFQRTNRLFKMSVLFVSMSLYGLVP